MRENKRIKLRIKLFTRITALVTSSILKRRRKDGLKRFTPSISSTSFYVRDWRCSSNWQC